MTAVRATRFSDVCGTVDELKRVLNERNRGEHPRDADGAYPGLHIYAGASGRCDSRSISGSATRLYGKH